MSMEFYKNGLHFQCQGSGKCCVSRGEYGYVYLTREDRKRMAGHLNLTVGEFRKRFCKTTEGVVHLVQPKDSENCVFLEKNRCSVYEARPVQCRTWPFWPENMNAKAWQKNVVDFCPGASVKTKESLRKSQDIRPQVLEQKTSERELFG